MAKDFNPYFNGYSTLTEVPSIIKQVGLLSFQSLF